MPVAINELVVTPTQTERPLRITTALGPDLLLLHGFHGEESVSRPFRFVLDVSTDGAVAPDPDALLGTPATVAVRLPSGGERTIHGLVSRFRRNASGAVVDGYQMELVPWLWMLSLSADCRIYQNTSVPDIVTGLFREMGYTDFRLALVKSYPPREYCVQYRESHLAFVSRLLEDEGIFYFFEHTEDKHTLVLADAPSAAAPCPGGAQLEPATAGAGAWASGRNAYTRLAVERTVHPAKVTLTDYHYGTPSTSLEASLEGEGGPGELFDFPGGYTAPGDGNRYARLRLEEIEAGRETAVGASAAAQLTAGCTVELAGTAASGGGDGNWFLLGVTHTAHQGGYRSGDGEAFSYENGFTAVRADVAWRPPRRTPQPRVRGTQSALVVGKAGEEIWTDAQGRVKLHFYWDRRSHRDENSSCWVRVSTAWAGKGWGQFSVPRIGQEVLVDFLEGDPDRPVVVGRVYNAEQPPPCNPGAGGMVSGMRSKTHKGSGYNAMEMDDTAGKEKIAIHAQYDMTTDVGHDDTQTVANDRKITVSGKHTETITGDTSITVSSGAYSLDVASGTAKVHVAGAVTENFDATQDTTVAQKITIASTGAAIDVSAATEITLTVGAASISMKADGTIAIDGVKITIDGATVDLTGQAKASMVVAAQSVTLNPALAELAGTMVKSTASAINEITGATVKLN